MMQTDITSKINNLPNSPLNLVGDINQSLRSRLSVTFNKNPIIRLRKTPQLNALSSDSKTTGFELVAAGRNLM